jgi:hypothetical protein
VKSASGFGDGRAATRPVARTTMPASSNAMAGRYPATTHSGDDPEALPRWWRRRRQTWHRRARSSAGRPRAYLGGERQQCIGRLLRPQRRAAGQDRCHAASAPRQVKVIPGRATPALGAGRRRSGAASTRSANRRRSTAGAGRELAAALGETARPGGHHRRHHHRRRPGANVRLFVRQLAQLPPPAPPGLGARLGAPRRRGASGPGRGIQPESSVGVSASGRWYRDGDRHDGKPSPLKTDGTR